jgi:hypothetical protein
VPRGAAKQGLAEDERGSDCHPDADAIHGKDHQAGTRRKEGAPHQDKNGQARPAGDEGAHQDGGHPVLGVLYGAAGHDCGDGAAEAQHQRDEGAAVQPYPVHRPVHDEGRPRQVAAVLQNGDGDKEEEYVGYEAEHRADAADNAVAE